MSQPILVVDAAPQQGTVVLCDNGRQLARVALRTTIPADLLARASLVVHRFPHGPATEPEVTSAPDRAAAVAAGAWEPADTAARWALWEQLAAATPARRQVAVYDDHWFRGLPTVERSYGLPAEFCAQTGLTRSGRHGALHRQATALADGGRVLSVLIDFECSVAAAVDGQPRYCSGGATACEGVPGLCSSGDVDPAAVLFLVDRLGWSLDAIEAALQQRGGLQGVSRGIASLDELLQSDAPDARLAVDLLLHRLRRAIGSAAAVLDGFDAVLWSGSAAALAPALLDRLVAPLGYLGLPDQVRWGHSQLDLITATAQAALPVVASVSPANRW
ncbi:MAG: acetate/propionate family kinase [Fimbriimonadaceae bacterium]|nr:acetate/propionate family kinase [Fimbriimonadaceae bacterium]